jgi:hypothetical protein
MDLMIPDSMPFMNSSGYRSVRQESESIKLFQLVVCSPHDKCVEAADREHTTEAFWRW